MLITIPRDIRTRMKSQMRHAGRREIGGILMGEETGIGSFRIVDFSVDAKTGSRAHFVRDAVHHKAALGEFFERTGHDYARFNYLGEWHTHPSFDVKPSRTDLTSMQRLVEGERDVDFVLLLIGRLHWYLKLECQAFLFIRSSRPDPVELVWE